MALTVFMAQKYAAQALLPAAEEEASEQARILVAHVLGCSVGTLVLRGEDLLQEEQQARLEKLLSRRLNREPLQYLLGEWEFMGLPFRVDENVLIPRQDTETLCETALSLIKEKGYKRVLDLCCGSGCVGISIQHYSGVEVVSSDISPACVALTKENAALNRADITAVESSWFENVPGRFDLILSNPPYLTGEDMQSLQPEVTYEPALALYGGEDGLSAYRAIREGYQACLNPGGMLLMEVGMGQAEDVLTLFGGGDTVKDLLGVDRVVCIGGADETE